MGYVYYCVFCGFHDSAEDQARSGLCEFCGGGLRRATEEDYPQIAARLDAGRLELRPRFDGAIPLAVLVAVPWLVGVRDALLVVAALFLVLGAALSLRAARREGEPAAAWRLYALAAVGGVVALGLGALGTALSFCAGATASLLLAAGLAVHTHARFSWASPDRMLVAAAAVLPATVAVSAAIVTDAGLRPGSAVVCALVAFWFAGVLSGCGRRSIDNMLGLRLLGVAAGSVAAISVAAVNGPGAIHVAASILAVAGWLLTDAAVEERPPPTIADVLTPAAPARAEEPAPVA
jgi:hypothetical protein